MADKFKFVNTPDFHGISNLGTEIIRRSIPGTPDPGPIIASHDEYFDTGIDVAAVFRDRLVDGYYDQLEATMGNIMAAGVPASRIRIGSPFIDIDHGSCVASIKSTITFR